MDTAPVNLDGTMTLTFDITGDASFFFKSGCVGRVEPAEEIDQIEFDVRVGSMENVIPDGDDAYSFRLGEHKVIQVESDGSEHLFCLECSKHGSVEQSPESSRYLHGMFVCEACQI